MLPDVSLIWLFNSVTYLTAKLYMTFVQMLNNSELLLILDCIM